MTPPTGPVFLSLPDGCVGGIGRRRSLPCRAARPAPGAASGAAGTGRRGLVQRRRPRRSSSATVCPSRERWRRPSSWPKPSGLGFTANRRRTPSRFRPTHPLFAGVLPGLSQGIRRALEPADVLLVIGLNLFQPFLYTARGPLPDGMTVVHIDSDPWEVGKTYPVKVGILSDPKAAMAQLTPLLRQRMTPSAAGCGQAAPGGRARAAPAGTQESRDAHR